MVLFRWFYDKETVSKRQTTTSNDVLQSLWNDKLGMTIQTYNKRVLLSAKIYALLDTNNTILGAWWRVIDATATAQLNQAEVVKVWLKAQGGDCTFKSIEAAVDRKVCCFAVLLLNTHRCYLVSHPMHLSQDLVLPPQWYVQTVCGCEFTCIVVDSCYAIIHTTLYSHV